MEINLDLEPDRHMEQEGGAGAQPVAEEETNRTGDHARKDEGGAGDQRKEEKPVEPKRQEEDKESSSRDHLGKSG